MNIQASHAFLSRLEKCEAPETSSDLDIGVLLFQRVLLRSYLNFCVRELPFVPFYYLFSRLLIRCHEPETAASSWIWLFKHNDVRKTDLPLFVNYYGQTRNFVDGLKVSIFTTISLDREAATKKSKLIHKFGLVLRSESVVTFLTKQKLRF